MLMDGRHVYDTLATDASARYFTMFYQWIGAEMERESTETPVCSADWTTSGSMLLVSMTALNFYHENRQQVSKGLGPDDRVIDNIRKLHFERVLRICTNRDFNSGESFDYVDLVANLECLYGYLDLFLAHPRMLQGKSSTSSGVGAVLDDEIVHECLSKTIENNGRRLRVNEGPEMQRHRELRALYLRISYKVPLFKNPDAINSLLAPWDFRESRAFKFKGPSEPHAFHDYISSLDCNAIDQILPAMPLDYQRHVILGLTETQKIGLQPCITRRYLSLCGMIQEFWDWGEVVKPCQITLK